MGSLLKWSKLQSLSLRVLADVGRLCILEAGVLPEGPAGQGEELGARHPEVRFSSESGFLAEFAYKLGIGLWFPLDNTGIFKYRHLLVNLKRWVFNELGWMLKICPSFKTTMIQKMEMATIVGCHPEVPQWNEVHQFAMGVLHPRGRPYLVPWAGVSI